MKQQSYLNARDSPPPSPTNGPVGVLNKLSNHFVTHPPIESVIFSWGVVRASDGCQDSSPFAWHDSNLSNSMPCRMRTVRLGSTIGART